MSRRLYDAAYAVIGHDPRRARLGHGPRLRRLRGAVGLVRRLGADHGQGLAGRDGPLRLRPAAVDRRGRRGRHARHPDPALDRLRDLRDPGAGMRSAGCSSPACCRASCCSRLFVATISILLRLSGPSSAPPGPRTTMAEKARTMLGALPIARGHPAHHRRHLRRHLLAGRGGGGGRGAGASGRRCSSGKLTPGASSGARCATSVVTTATVMLILIAAHLINPFLALSQIPTAVGEFLTALALPPLGDAGADPAQLPDPRLLPRRLRDAGADDADLLPGHHAARHRPDPGSASSWCWCSRWG